MNTSKIIDRSLWVLIAIGFLGALKVSYANFTGTVCPSIGVALIFYVVLTMHS